MNKWAWRVAYLRGQMIEHANMARVAKATKDFGYAEMWNVSAANNLFRLGGMMGDW
jgi:hypothetical protein|nr:MAG TPA: hypothetical protein [Caudoviricetes sp.]